MGTRDQFDSLSPVDYRYWDEEVAKYLSENGFTRYKLLVVEKFVGDVAITFDGFIWCLVQAVVYTCIGARLIAWLHNEFCGGNK